MKKWRFLLGGCGGGGFFFYCVWRNKDMKGTGLIYVDSRIVDSIRLTFHDSVFLYRQVLLKFIKIKGS